MRWKHIKNLTENQQNLLKQYFNYVENNKNKNITIKRMQYSKTNYEYKYSEINMKDALVDINNELKVDKRAVNDLFKKGVLKLITYKGKILDIDNPNAKVWEKGDVVIGLKVVEEGKIK